MITRVEKVKADQEPYHSWDTTGRVYFNQFDALRIVLKGESLKFKVMNNIRIHKAELIRKKQEMIKSFEEREEFLEHLYELAQANEITYFGGWTEDKLAGREEE